MILIVDDNETVRLSLSLLLKRAGHDVAAVATPDEAITAARSEASLRLAVIDMNFSTATDGRQGLELLQRLKVLRPEMPVILITAWGSIPLAVEGMRLGACDFITKPWVNRVMLQRVETALALAAPKADVSCGDFDASGIIGSDTALASVLRTAARIASTNASVLILGENGTGKELIAQAIHRNSPRRDGPFVMVNLGGISRSLFESEMFGHAKGAFTGAVADRKGRFELADKGTIFLDEIGDLDAGSQVKLLRVLQEHTFERLGDSTPRQSDFRLIAATNADLQAMVADGRFREDLFYRINLIVLRLPPLRERLDDIGPLASHFAAKAASAMGLKAPEIAPDAIAWLRSLPWPGNIRQLRNLVERTVLLTPSARLHADDFRTTTAMAGETQQSDSKDTPASPASLDDSERRTIEAAMRTAKGNVTHAASILGVTRQTLYRKLKKHGLAD